MWLTFSKNSSGASKSGEKKISHMQNYQQMWLTNTRKERYIICEMKKDTPPSPVFLMERPRAAWRALGGGVRGGEAGLATLSDLPSPRTSAETEYRITAIEKTQIPLARKTTASVNLQKSHQLESPKLRVGKECEISLTPRYIFR